ncbi:MAG: hypothetical protein ABIP54_04465 [Candidatus Andersenbacteria bacterium]
MNINPKINDGIFWGIFLAIGMAIFLAVAAPILIYFPPFWYFVFFFLAKFVHLSGITPVFEILYIFFMLLGTAIMLMKKSVRNDNPTRKWFLLTTFILSLAILIVVHISFTPAP